MTLTGRGDSEQSGSTTLTENYRKREESITFSAHPRAWARRTSY